MRTKTTLQKLISFTQTEIDHLLVQKSNIEFEINSLKDKIIALQESLDYELQSCANETFDHYYMATFMEFQLKKQKEINIEIESNTMILDNLIEEIVSKEIDKKKYEHLVNEYLIAEQREIDKQEQNMIDEYSLRIKNSG
jgi:hypothetical protein